MGAETKASQLQPGPGTRSQDTDADQYDDGIEVRVYASNPLDPGVPAGPYIDADGDVVWWYRAFAASLGRARMSADGQNMWMVNSGLAAGSLERVSMDTLDSEVYPVGSSHDVTAVTGSTMAYLDYSEDDCDSIYEIDPSGATVEVFESEGVVPSSGCHSNALRYSQTEDVYTFSDHHTDVLVINREGGVEWSLTDIVPGGSSNDWGGAQHGHQSGWPSGRLTR